MFEICYIFKGYISSQSVSQSINQSVTILPYIFVAIRDRTVNYLCVYFPTSLCFYVFVYGTSIHAYTQHFNIISIGQELMCSIHFLSFRTFLGLLDGTFRSKV
jgi:hypothetical protein